MGPSLSPCSHHPSLQPRSGATTFKVRAGAWLRDGPTLRLSLCTDLASAPPAWPSGSPGGAHSPGNLLPGLPAARTPPRGPSWGGPELPSPLLPPPSPSPRRVPLTVVPGRPPGTRQHVGGLQGVVGGGRHPAALKAVPFDLLYQEGARHGATGRGLGGGTCVGPRWGEVASRARLAVCAGFQHWTAPSGRRAGGSAEPAPVAAAPARARLPLGLGGGGAQTGDRWSCAQHSGCRLYMGRRLEEIRWSPSNGTVQRSNPSNVPQDNRSAHVPLNRRRWGQARRREQRAGRRGEREDEEGAEM